MDFRQRIAVWRQTKERDAARFPAPPAFKIQYAADSGVLPRFADTHVSVANADSIAAGHALVQAGHRPLVLILADHRFAGGDVASGSGAQEESLFRRTNLCATLLQNAFYPVQPDEALVSNRVTVFRDTEERGCAPLESPFLLDFIACPGLHNPELSDDGALRRDDEDRLRVKLRLIFQGASANGNDSLVLGAMGCGAWRNPPAHVARIMREEVERARGAFARIVVACLEVDARDYIVLHRDRGESNFRVFAREFGS
jgi:uncharacterized protein (TIGR02452 family)